jgi:hypothetical protein
MPNPDPHFLLVRRPVRGQIRPQNHWLTLNGGWTTDSQKALIFASRDAARRTLGTRDGEITYAGS